MKFVQIEKLEPHKLYKVCQITIDGEPLMYFVEDGCGYYHKDILKEVLTLNGLTHTVVRKLGNEGYAFHGEGFVVDGMGGAKVYSEPEKCIMLFGNSIDYDMSISEAHVEEYKKINPNWEFKTPPFLKESFAS